MDEPKYNVSADIVGHMQLMSDLPEIGATVRAGWRGVDVQGEVFAHIPHPNPDHAGWGFALIKFT